MVDAAASFDQAGTNPPVAAALPRAAGQPVWQVGNGAAITEAYAKIAAGASVSPSQSVAWISAWLNNVKPDHFIAICRSGDVPLMAVAMEVEKQGPLQIAHFMGGRHACGNFPALTAAGRQIDPAVLVEGLRQAVAKARPDIDVLSCERLAATYDGFANPLLTLQHLPSPNLALAVDLSGGFEGVLERSSGKRKKKKHRSQTRKFEAVGPFRRIRADTPDAVRRTLDAFFEMKEVRFRQKGIPNVFGAAEVRAFFTALFTNALGPTRPAFVLHALEVAGTLRAVTGSSYADNRLVCEFGAIADDELANASPGDFLFFDNIEEACAQGLAVYDFSVGDERYKRLWCDLEIVQFDAYVPLTMRGYALAAVMRAQNRAKSFIKNSPLVWKVAKAFRKRTAGAPKDDEE